MNLEPSPPASDRLVRIAYVAQLLDKSARQVWCDDLAGKLPAPVRIGRAVRWRLDELQAWRAAGCPPRDEWAVRWQAIQDANAKGRLLTSRPFAR